MDRAIKVDVIGPCRQMTYPRVDWRYIPCIMTLEHKEDNMIKKLKNFYGRKALQKYEMKTDRKKPVQRSQERERQELNYMYIYDTTCSKRPHAFSLATICIIIPQCHIFCYEIIYNNFYIMKLVWMFGVRP